jgi:hypothetical protein
MKICPVDVLEYLPRTGHRGGRRRTAPRRRAIAELERPAGIWVCRLSTSLGPRNGPRHCSMRSNYRLDLEPRYGIEP